MRKKCSDKHLPMVRMALEPKKCLRRKGPIFTHAEDIADFINIHYGCEPQEVFLSLAINPRNEVLHVQEISLGGFSSTQADPKVVFAGALLSGASAIILVHNHPSGDSEPSQLDISLTHQLYTAGMYLTIRVLDHIVIGRGGSFTSMLRRGLMPRDGGVGGLGGLGDEEQAHYGGT